MKSSKYCRRISSLSSSLLSQCCNGWARLRTKKRSRQSLWSMRLPPYSQDGEAKKRGYPSGGRPCPRWSAHVKAILLRAQCTRRCCCSTFPVFLAPSSSLSSAPGSSNAPMRRRSTSATLCHGGCIQTRLFHSLLPLNSRVDKLHSCSHLYPSLYSPSVLPVLSPRFFFVLSAPSRVSYRRRSARDALLFSFLIPLTLALFSLSSALFTRFPWFVAINIRWDVIFNSAPHRRTLVPWWKRWWKSNGCKGLYRITINLIT